MGAQLVKNSVFSVGALHSDRRLFDELIPLPEGTSYNSYLVKGSEKTALLDTVDPAKEKVLIENLAELGIKKIDFIISHHAEQDHSGSLPKILDLYPSAKIVTSVRCKEMLQDHLLISDDKFIIINDRETLSLGDKTIEFIFAPWVHWPETMFTYLKEDRVLFTCDFLGSHFASKELFADEIKALQEAKRYYAEIMMPFRTSIRKHLEAIKNYPIEIIATSHGPIYNKPAAILELYRQWASDEVKNEVVVPYVSMHGSTVAMVKYFSDALAKKGITVKLFDLARADLGELAVALVDAATLVIGSSTFLSGPHPSAAFAANLINALRPKIKIASIIGSYGWGGKMVETLKGLLLTLKVDWLEPVVAKGCPKEADFKSLDRLVEEISNAKFYRPNPAPA